MKIKIVNAKFSEMREVNVPVIALAEITTKSESPIDGIQRELIRDKINLSDDRKMKRNMPG